RHEQHLEWAAAAFGLRARAWDAQKKLRTGLLSLAELNGAGSDIASATMPRPRTSKEEKTRSNCASCRPMVQLRGSPTLSF
ncbi:MAG TPA: hypothetical protein VJ834_05250, partial [Burkholderiales bacterium]|nr:hypothetical protein [Burkholderiales bacterium]